MPYDGDLIDDAFLIYRNYDGHHSEFGNTWIHSTSSNQSQLAVYGARRSSDGAYTILVINKTASSLNSKLTLTGIASSGSAQTWRWTGKSIAPIAGVAPFFSSVVVTGSHEASVEAVGDMAVLRYLPTSAARPQRRFLT